MMFLNKNQIKCLSGPDGMLIVSLGVGIKNPTERSENYIKMASNYMEIAN